MCRDNGKGHSTATNKIVLKPFYLDSLLKLVLTDTEAIGLILEVASMMKKARFRIVKFIWDKVFKNGSSKICGRQPLKDLRGYGLFPVSSSIVFARTVQIKD